MESAFAGFHLHCSLLTEYPYRQSCVFNIRFRYKTWGIVIDTQHAHHEGYWHIVCPPDLFMGILVLCNCVDKLHNVSIKHMNIIHLRACNALARMRV